MKILFIPGVIGKNQRDLIFPGQIPRSTPDQHGMMHMDHIKIPVPKASLDFRVQTVRYRKAAGNSPEQGTISDNICFLLLIIIAWSKDHHLMTAPSKSLCQPLDRNRYASNKRFIIICHHCNFHYLLLLPSFPLSVQILKKGISKEISCSHKE